MKLEVSDISDKFIWILTVSLFVCFLVFDTYVWGKYYFLAGSALILLLSSLQNRGKFRFEMGAYQWFLLFFLTYALLSAVWAMNSSDSIVKARTLFRILICSTFLYIHYIEKDDIYSLLRAIMWAGYIVAIYSILFYGLDNLLRATQISTMRLDNEYSNVNSLGMACALSCVLQFAELLYKEKRRWTAILLIPTVVVMAATQSRKALIFALIGILVLLVIKNIDSENFLKSFFKILVGVFVAIVVLLMLSRLDIFGGISERMASMLNLFTGEGKVDSSTLKRNYMVALGIAWWKKHPILGIGIGCPHIINAQYLNFDAYLHNNFVELLCGGGLIGFCLYYSIYVYLFVNLWKYRHADKKYVSVCFVWLALMLAMDYGMVSYYSKTTCFYLMVHFVNIQCLKRKAEAYEHPQII